MTHLLDTNVVSALRRPERMPEDVRQRLDELGDVMTSVVVLEEIVHGIELRRRRDPVAADLLEAWLHDVVLPDFAGRVLPIDDQVAIACGQIRARRTVGLADSLVAATALVHGLVVVTRNRRDFSDVPDLAVLDPWTEESATGVKGPS